MNDFNLYIRKIFLLIVICISENFVLRSQPLEIREGYDISKDKVLYVVGYSHLDTEWNWDYTTTIDALIKNIMTENFHLFEKYPEYVFNFTGSRRYHMMKEYYPELYKKIGYYIKQGRWYVSGSSVDEGEVNVSSSESLIRQVLYGNNYFRKEFGVESYDYMLPDCFGFLANMPSIWNHCGLIGFSTQKLTWRSAVGVPFNVGTWYGPDGKGILAALNATNYVGSISPRLDLDENWENRLKKDYENTGYAFDYRYYGVGDMGGAPRENDVKNAIGSLNNSDSKFKVVLTSSDQMYKDITPEIQKSLPAYTGDMLLIEHSAGSLTSQSFMKKMNRKNELLAQSAEQLAVMADFYGLSCYPYEKLNNAWELVLGSQFHDILPGTSIPKAYEYAWNDEFIAANGFSEVLKNSVASIIKNMDTEVEGRAVVVYNPVSIDREDIVTAQLKYEKLPADIMVVDEKGEVVPSQIIEKKDNILMFIFRAEVPSVGMAVYDVKERSGKTSVKSVLKITDRTLENEYYKVIVDGNGDFTSIYDKKMKRELLLKPARLEFQAEESFEWPAWNMHWDERQKPPFDFMNKGASFRILEDGPVRVALEVKRKGQGSEIIQVISLSIGEAGKRLEINNELDWQSKGVSLKAAFPLTATNNVSTYNLGVGTIDRGVNDKLKFEVPSKEWFDQTDETSKFGVSILEDCKYGSDKPDENTLRLTLMFTPGINNRYVVQGSQDWGIHTFKYGIYSHKGDWKKGLSPWQGRFINQPLLAFESPQHEGPLGKSISFLGISSPQVGLMAFKKKEGDDYYIVRVNELLGKDASGINIKFPGQIDDAYEVNGQEKKIGEVSFTRNTLNFNISHYTLKTFAVKFKSKTNNFEETEQMSVMLPYNLDAFSFDDNRDDGRLDGKTSMPAELMPDEIESEGIRFKMGSTEDGQDNAVICKGQEINLPDGEYSTLYILATAKKETKGKFTVDGEPLELDVQGWTGYVGQYYNRRFALDNVSVTDIDSPFVKMDNIAWFASHRHLAYPSKNDAYHYSYIYKYRIDLPQNTTSITFPNSEDIRVFAITAVKNGVDDIKPLQPLYDQFEYGKQLILRECPEHKNE